MKSESLEVAKWEKYTSFLNHLDEFNPVITFINQTPSLVKAFKKYLEEGRGGTGSTLKVHFDKFKKVMTTAEKENYELENQK